MGLKRRQTRKKIPPFRLFILGKSKFLKKKFHMCVVICCIFLLDGNGSENPHVFAKRVFLKTEIRNINFATERDRESRKKSTSNHMRRECVTMTMIIIRRIFTIQRLRVIIDSVHFGREKTVSNSRTINFNKKREKKIVIKLSDMVAAFLWLSICLSVWAIFNIRWSPSFGAIESERSSRQL